MSMVCMYVRRHICMHVSVFMHACMYVCMYAHGRATLNAGPATYMRVYIFLCIHVFICVCKIHIFVGR